MPPANPPSGHVGNLTAEQQQVLDQFRESLKELGIFDAERHDDYTLLRFLRARKFNLENAKKMISDHEKWRKDFGVDDLVKNPDFLEGKRLYPQYYHKTDKDGRPVYIEQPGRVDTSALTPEGKKLQLRRLVYEYEKFTNERLPACSAEAGYYIETSCTIMDLDNVGISTLWNVHDYVKDCAAVGQNQYPETMGKFYIINAPWGFSAALSAVKKLLDPVTAEKIVVFGRSEKKEMTNELLKQIPAANLPPTFGGACGCGGVEGCMNSDAGPWNKPVEAGAAVGGETSAAVAST